jgi:hypothetical protein
MTEMRVLRRLNIAPLPGIRTARMLVKSLEMREKRPRLEANGESNRHPAIASL